MVLTVEWPIAQLRDEAKASIRRTLADINESASEEWIDARVPAVPDIPDVAVRLLKGHLWQQLLLGPLTQVELVMDEARGRAELRCQPAEKAVSVLNE